jgi:DNA repair photolyase
MQRTNIDWCLRPDGKPGHSWNPAFGCEHGCPYCYGQVIANRFYKGDFSPRFYPERVAQPNRLRKPSMVFLGSMTDMFGEWVQQIWWDKILRLSKITLNIYSPLSQKLLRESVHISISITSPQTCG